MAEIVLAEEHAQVYDFWRERGLSGLSLSHVDFHCDMRGLLVDRRRGRAWLLDAHDPRVSVIDSGNFLGHAVMQGLVRSVRWIHDDFGGRRHDVGTVKYEGDLTALPHRLLHRLRPGPEAPLALEDLTFAEWDGVRPGEHLDIDWDGIASIDYDLPRIERLTAAFLARRHPAIPPLTYLVYSPGYSHPDRGLYERFAERLAASFGARIRRLPPPTTPPPRIEPPTWLGRLERDAILALHRLGIY